MDDLDRLAFRLVRRARESYPQFLTHGFALADVEERLLPYVEARREMADGTTAAWETTVLRLLSGERGYISPDPALRDACLRALQNPSPAVSLVRGVAYGTLKLGQKSFPAGRKREGDTQSASPSAPGTGEGALNNGQQAGAGSAVQSHSANTHGATQATAQKGPGKANTAQGSAQGSVQGSVPSGTTNAPQSQTQTHSHPRRGCRYCGGRLPEGRTVHFCPHCGADLTKRQCPACSTELEFGWRFCVTCGRGNNQADQELEQRLKAVASG